MEGCYAVRSTDRTADDEIAARSAIVRHDAERLAACDTIFSWQRAVELARRTDSCDPLIVAVA
jgi:hypothetical protein